MKELGSPEAMWQDFQSFVEGNRYDLIVFCKTNGMHPELVSYAKNFGTVCYWFMDNIEVAKAINAIEYVKRSDLASATSEEVFNLFKKHNPNTIQTLEGFDPSIYFKETSEKIYDVVFIGTATPKRIQVISEINLKHHVTVFGENWPKELHPNAPLYNEDMRKIVNKSKIVLNLVHSNIFSDRVILSAASGSFVLSQYCHDLERHFTRKKHLDWFTGIEEAQELIRYYLVNEEERERIAYEGMLYVRKNFTWNETCKTLWTNVKKAKEKKSSAMTNHAYEFKKETCPICKGVFSDSHVEKLLKCSSCGLFRKKDFPSKTSLKKVLQNFMLSACSSSDGEKKRLKVAESQLDLIEKYTARGRVYDVGAAGGFFMKAAQDRGWIVEGNEISTSAIKWAKDKYNIDIDYGFLEELNPKTAHYDAVVLWNTLEHTIDPDQTLGICSDILKEGGVVLIQLPIKNDRDVKDFYEELHTYEFSKENIILLLEKHKMEILETIDNLGLSIPHLTIVCQKLPDGKRARVPFKSSNAHSNRVPMSTMETKHELNEDTVMKHRVLFVSWHGLGDNIMLTPALRKYRQKYPNRYIAVAGLKRFGNKLIQLLSGLPFIDKVIPALPDAWNDFPEYNTGVNAVIEEAKKIAIQNNFNELVILPTNKRPGFMLHKIFRFAIEVGVEFENMEDLQTELSIDKEAEERALSFLSNYRKPILVAHTKAGNTSKTLSKEFVEEVFKKYEGYTIMEFGRQSLPEVIYIGEDDIEFSKALIKHANMVIAIDSVVMHIAGALGTPCIAIFTITPVHQALPLRENIIPVGIDNENTQLSEWEKYKNEIIRKYSYGEQYDGKILITGPGHSGTNWATEIVNLSGKFHFTKSVEDRELFFKESLPKGYGTKLATDNIGMYPENLDKLMQKSENLKIIFTMRHPVDNCLSKIYRATPSNEHEPSPDMINYSWDGTVNGAIKSIEHAYTIYSYLTTHYPDRILPVKLEDLITNTEFEVNRICNFLNIPKNEKMLEAYRYSRNKYHHIRYNSELDKTQMNLYKRWPEIYNSFFKDKKYIVDQLFTNLKEITEKLGYSLNGAPKKIRINKIIRLPQHYYSPATYWAHMITLRCTAACPFCILDGRGKHQRSLELSGREILSFWNSIEHKQGQKLSLIGGEPTLHKDIVEIVNNLEDYDITITTNCKSPFYSDPQFYKKFKPKSGSTLRINTTFHPHFISPEEYIEIIQKYRQTGHFVDQTSYVYHPDINKYLDAIERVSKEITITASPYLGFYDDIDKFNAPFAPENIEPNENYYDLEAASRICGLTDLDAYRDICGQFEKRKAMCAHPLLSLIIGPDGHYYHCHYKLYYGIDPVSHISDFKPTDKNHMLCRHYGFCNWCDVPRLGCRPNQTAKRQVLNKLYDKREFQRSEVQHLVKEVSEFSAKYNLEYNPLKWFEYSYTLLYSGHRHGCRVLDVGSAKSVFPYFLASKGYNVTTIDIANSDFRDQAGKRFNVTSITEDLRAFNPELESKFDMISNLSVIEHIDADTNTVLNLAKYLKPGGIMVISTDFYDRHIEYPNANREIVRDRPTGSHTDSRIYTKDTFLARIVYPLEQAGLKRVGLTDYRNVDISDPTERAVRGLYTFGISILRKDY